MEPCEDKHCVLGKGHPGRNPVVHQGNPPIHDYAGMPVRYETENNEEGSSVRWAFGINEEESVLLLSACAFVAGHLRASSDDPTTRVESDQYLAMVKRLLEFRDSILEGQTEAEKIKVSGAKTGLLDRLQGKGI